MARVTQKPDEVVISDRTYLSQQSWYRERIVTRGDRRIRYLVRCNAYDFQSYGRAELWNGEEWQTIHQIPGELLKTKASYVKPDVKPEAFNEDIAELRRVAIAVI